MRRLECIVHRNTVAVFAGDMRTEPCVAVLDSTQAAVIGRRLRQSIRFLFLFTMCVGLAVLAVSVYIASPLASVNITQERPTLYNFGYYCKRCM